MQNLQHISGRSPIFRFPLNPLSITLIFHHPHLPPPSSSITLIFHHPHLPSPSSSITLIFHHPHLPSPSSSITLIFHHPHLLFNIFKLHSVKVQNGDQRHYQWHHQRHDKGISSRSSRSSCSREAWNGSLSSTISSPTSPSS
jgi:hypothetical protein